MIFARRLLTALKGNRPWMAVAIASAVLEVVLAIVAVLLVRQAFRIVQGDASPFIKSMGLLFALLLLVYAVRSVFLYLQDAVGHAVAYRVLHSLRMRVYTHVQRLPHSYLVRQETGNITSRLVNDVETIELFIAHGLVQIVVAVTIPVAIAVVLLVINWQLALITLIPVPVLLLLIKYFIMPLRRSFRRTRAELGNVHTVMVDSVEGLPVIKSFTYEKEQAEKVAKRSWAHSQASMHNAIMGGWVGSVSELTAGIGLAIVLLIAGYGWLGALSLPNLFLFIVFSIQLSRPLLEMNRMNEGLQNAMAAAERVFEVLDAEPEASPQNGARLTQERSYDLAFRQVRFGYEPGKEVLHGATFEVREGEIVALVGPSGAGKTTCANLIARFWDPQEGAISLGEQDIRSLPTEEYRRQVSLVLQDVFLFNASIEENIRIGKPGATKDDIVQAARAANAHDFILEMPQGYETVIGERGVRLSGGQKQRLSLARAILKDAPILVLDEATSSVDPETEHLIQEAIDRLAARRKAIIVIAHRLSTIRQADRIVVLDKGNVVDIGTHEELLARPGIYATLYRVQAQAREWKLARKTRDRVSAVGDT